MSVLLGLILGPITLICKKRMNIQVGSSSFQGHTAFNTSPRNNHMAISLIMCSNVIMIITMVYFVVFVDQLNLVKQLLTDHLLAMTELSIIAPIAFFVENPKIFKKIMKNLKS